MTPERKYEIALMIYRVELQERGIRFFPEKAGKEVEKIRRRVQDVDPQYISFFLDSEYRRIVYLTFNPYKEKLPFDPQEKIYVPSFPAGKIALAILLDMAAETGKLRLNVDDFKKKIGYAHKATGLPKQELLEFYSEVVSDFFKSIKV